MYTSEPKILPIPHHNFFITESEQAFRQLQRGTNGKIIIQVPEDGSQLSPPPSPSSMAVSFDPKGSYLLTSKFGSIRKSIAT